MRAEFVFYTLYVRVRTSQHHLSRTGLPVRQNMSFHPSCTFIIHSSVIDPKWHLRSKMPHTQYPLIFAPCNPDNCLWRSSNSPLHFHGQCPRSNFRGKQTSTGLWRQTILSSSALSPILRHKSLYMGKTFVYLTGLKCGGRSMAWFENQSDARKTE